MRQYGQLDPQVGTACSCGLRLCDYEAVSAREFRCNVFGYPKAQLRKVIKGSGDADVLGRKERLGGWVGAGRKWEPSWTAVWGEEGRWGALGIILNYTP